MLSLQDLKFVSNDQPDYIRRLERAYEKQQEEIKRLREEVEGWRNEFQGI